MYKEEQDYGELLWPAYLLKNSAITGYRSWEVLYSCSLSGALLETSAYVNHEEMKA